MARSREWADMMFGSALADAATVARIGANYRLPVSPLTPSTALSRGVLYWFRAWSIVPKIPADIFDAIGQYGRLYARYNGIVNDDALSARFKYGIGTASQTEFLFEPAQDMTAAPIYAAYDAAYREIPRGADEYQGDKLRRDEAFIHGSASGTATPELIEEKKLAFRRAYPSAATLVVGATTRALTRAGETAGEIVGGAARGIGRGLLQIPWWVYAAAVVAGGVYFAPQIKMGVSLIQRRLAARKAAS